jgi:hypothetical protein
MRIETIILQRPVTGWVVVGTVANLVHRLTRRLHDADEDAPEPWNRLSGSQLEAVDEVSDGVFTTEPSEDGAPPSSDAAAEPPNARL